MSVVVKLPTGYFPDPDEGRPVALGTVFIGTIDTDPTVLANRINVTLVEENGTEVVIAPASQPLTLNAGGVFSYNGSVVQVQTEGNYSMTVLDAHGVQQYYFTDSNAFPSVGSTILYTSGVSDSLAVTSTGLSAGGRIATAHYNSTFTLDSGSPFQATGITTAGKAGNVPDADGFFYDADGTQLQIEGVRNVRQYGALLDGVTDDSDALQIAVNSSGATVIDFLDIQGSIVTALTVPAGVEITRVNLLAATAGMNMVLVNSGCKVSGLLTGLGTVSDVERGIYPAADGVVDVVLDVEVTNLTYGVHPAQITSVPPKRWSGKIYAHDVVGTTGVSEGYGLILETAEDCSFLLYAKDIKRHALYLTAGAQRNRIEAHVDGCANYAVQMFSTSSQTETSDNEVVIFAQNLTADVADQSGPLAIVQKAHRNIVTIHHAGDNASARAVLVEGASTGPYPLSNSIINCKITGQYTSADVVKLLNADSTRVSKNDIAAYATTHIIATRRTGTNGSVHAGYFDDNTIDGMGQNVSGIYTEANAQPTWIGINNIRNNGSGLRVNDATGGLREGFSKKVSFSGTTASITAGTAANTEVTLSSDIKISSRRTAVFLSGASVDYLANSGIIGTAGPSAENKSAFRTFNASVSNQTFDFTGWVEGD